VIIGLCGAAGSGKSSVGSLLHLRHGYAAWAFADPLYEAVSAITGVPVADLQERSQKEKVIPWLGASPRRLLQTLGTEWGRQMIHDQIWIEATFRRIEASNWSHHVICDVRFANEAAAIRCRGGLVLRVSRPAKNTMGPAEAAHSSEGGVPDEYVLATIENSGSLGDLEATVDSLIARLHGDTMK
jgi:hypothetical protein